MKMFETIVLDAIIEVMSIHNDDVDDEDINNDKNN